MTRFIRCDRGGGQIGDLQGVVSAIRSRTVDSDDNYGDATCDKLTLTLAGDIEEGDRVLYQDSTGQWAEWVAKVPDTVRQGSKPVTTCKCVSSFEYDLAGKWVESLETSDLTPMQYVTAALSGTVWSVGTVDPASQTMSETGELNSYSAYKQDAISALHGLCKVYGYEMYSTVTCDSNGVASRSLNLVTRRGSEDATWRFEYRRDLKEIRRTYSGKRVLTKAHVFGKGEPIMNELNVFTGHYNRKITIADVNGGKDYLEDTSLIPYFGTMQADGTLGHTEGRIDFEQCEDVNSLLTLGRAAFEAQKTPQISYEASVVALARAGMDLGGCDIGDSVQIVDTSFNEPLRLNGRVIAIEEDLLRGADSIKLTIGSIVSSRAKTVRELTKTVQQIESSSYAYNSVVGGSNSAMGTLIDRLNAMFAEAGGFVTMDDETGIMVMNAATFAEATKAIQINGAGLRIANSKVNGDWNWRTFGTGDGFTADEIIAGIIQDETGTNYWNLDTGELRIASTASVGGATAGDLVGAVYSTNLVPFSADISKDHGWGLSNSTASGNEASIVAPTASNWAYYVKTSFIQYSQLKGKTVTLSFKAVVTSGSTNGTIIAQCDLWEPAATARKRWSGNVVSATVTTTAKTFTGTFTVNDAFFASGTDSASASDLVRVALYSRTLNVPITVSEIKLEYGTAATAWSTAPSDSGTYSLDYALDQNEVFDRLTGGGANQGIYLSNGNVYVNASYIQTGTLSADRIDAYTLKAARIGTDDDHYAIIGEDEIYADNDTNFVLYNNGNAGFTVSTVVDSSGGVMTSMGAGNRTSGLIWTFLDAYPTQTTLTHYNVRYPTASARRDSVLILGDHRAELHADYDNNYPRIALISSAGTGSTPGAEIAYSSSSGVTVLQSGVVAKAAGSSMNIGAGYANFVLSGGGVLQVSDTNSALTSRFGDYGFQVAAGGASVTDSAGNYYLIGTKNVKGGRTTATTIAAGAGASFSITFTGVAYSSVPHVTATARYNSTSAPTSAVVAMVYNVTATGFGMRLINVGSASVSVIGEWISYI